jgi:hypothetical protein
MQHDISISLNGRGAWSDVLGRCTTLARVQRLALLPAANDEEGPPLVLAILGETLEQDLVFTYVTWRALYWAVHELAELAGIPPR